MTNDLLPDEIYVRRTTKKGLSAVRPESPLADRTVPNQASKLNRTKYIRGDLVSTPNKPADVDLPELLTDDERKAMLSMAEQLFSDLKENKLGGYSGINRPFWILSCFKEVIEKFGHRDVGLKWSKDMLEAAKEKHLATGKGGGEPAAPTQIDAGELEKAIMVVTEANDAEDAVDILECGSEIDIVLQAARAHLSKLSGG